MSSIIGLINKFFKKNNNVEYGVDNKKLANYSILRYIVYFIFIILHITFILLVMLGPFFTPYILIFHFIISISWIVLNYECIGSIIERRIHPNGLSLFGKITWHSFALLWFHFFLFSVYWIVKKRTFSLKNFLQCKFFSIKTPIFTPFLISNTDCKK